MPRSSEEGSSAFNNSQQLPPLPKLRPRPGLLQVQPQRGGNIVSSPLGDDRRDDDDDNDGGGTSRLLMKSDCKGRKRNSRSLVHSIPKFSQVRPNERLTEVQKVLQSRIISKQQRLMQQQQQQQHDHANESPVSITHDQVMKPKSDVNRSKTPLMQYSEIKPKALQHVESSSLQASNLLQNIVSLHRQRVSGSLQIIPASCTTTTATTTMTTATASSLTASTTGGSSKRRGRKPAKEEICHVVTAVSDDRTKKADLPAMTNLPPAISLPVFSEVTITPTSAPHPDSKRRIQDLDRALDLTKSRTSPEVVDLSSSPSTTPTSTTTSTPLPPMLNPVDFERLGSPQGYVFCPSSNVFVHPSALDRQLAEYHKKSQVSPKLMVCRNEPLQSSMRTRPPQRSSGGGSGGGEMSTGNGTRVADVQLQRRQGGEMLAGRKRKSFEGNNEVGNSCVI